MIVVGEDRSFDRAKLPEGTEYVVVFWSASNLAACFANEESAFRCVVRNGALFDCEIIRVEGDVCVWPWHSKGGTA